jgi:excisionase family DNA binding protein
MSNTTIPNQTKATLIPEPLLSPEQLAQMLNIPLGTVYQWRHRGGGPTGIKIGRHVRYRMSDIETWLESKTT